MGADRSITKSRFSPDGFLQLYPRNPPQSSLPIREVYLIRIRPGGSTAGHFHRVKHEWVAALNVPADSVLYSSSGTKVSAQVLQPLTDLVYIPPGVVHLFRNRGKQPLILMILSSVTYDPSHPDKVRAPEPTARLPSSHPLASLRGGDPFRTGPTTDTLLSRKRSLPTSIDGRERGTKRRSFEARHRTGLEGASW